MAAEVQDPKLEKVDSAVSDQPGSPTDKKEKPHRRTSSTSANVANIADLGKTLQKRQNMHVLTRTSQRRRAWRSRSLLKRKDSTGKPCLKFGNRRSENDTDTLNRKLNTSPATVDDKDALKKPLCQPLVKKVDLHFPLGLEVTARNLKGVTIKDALDAIYKQYKKKVRSRHTKCPMSSD
jgi:hypothetical protein